MIFIMYGMAHSIHLGFKCKICFKAYFIGLLAVIFSFVPTTHSFSFYLKNIKKIIEKSAEMK